MNRESEFFAFNHGFQFRLEGRIIADRISDGDGIGQVDDDFRGIAGAFARLADRP